MRSFEIIDSETPHARPCAVLMCDQGRDVFTARVEEGAGPEDVPLAFAPFVARGERDIPAKWVRAWVDERIAPLSRQNIGQVLREHGLDRYDALELLLSNQGRSSQDGFYLREIDGAFKGSAALGRTVARLRAEVGLSQDELARRAGMRQESLSRLENGDANPTAKTLESIAAALGRKLTISFEQG